MKIILSEKKLLPMMLNEIINEYGADKDLNSQPNPNYTNPYKKAITNSRETLKKLIKNQGQLMLNVSNGKQYFVYEIIALANIIGKRFGICQLYKDNECSGTILIKPMVSFKPIY